jgi:adenylate cyclase
VRQFDVEIAPSDNSHMPLEIERRFLVTNEGWRKRAGEGARIQQGYIAIGDLASVRVRIRGKSKATLTVKSRTSTARRLEFEYAIPCEDAVALLPLCLGSIIEKVRYLLRRRHLTWEIDVFEGQNAGLIIAEVELRDEKQPLELPAWLGQEITSQNCYSNANLAVRPFSSW